ncbi:hypothetical protein TMatcc_005073 [Talaromyces marneffei ATCC 18224]
MYSIPKPPSFSNLESSIIRNEVQPRPNSAKMNNVWHNAWLPEREVNELDFTYNIESRLGGLSDLKSLHGVFNAVQLNTHLAKETNFSNSTSIQCLQADGHSLRQINMDDCKLSNLLREYRESTVLSTNGMANSDSSRYLKPSSFMALIPMTRDLALDMFSSLKLNPLFFLNMLGRPDYWAPQTRWETSSDNAFQSCDFFCQHPRWNLEVQGAPLSVCLRYEANHGRIIYVIAHKVNDNCVDALRHMLNVSIQRPSSLIEDPFDIHVLLSTLSFEASKYHITHFRRFMWSQFNRVEEQIGGGSKDRAELRELTRKLQIISQNADSHIANADVAIISAKGIQAAHAKLHRALKSPLCSTERGADTTEYVINSLEKQKLWFLNYKNRKDGMMSLVFNLVTQQDAANSIEIAADTKRDSTSMNAIAALTMVFLPGTFTATILGAGIFSASTNGNGIRVSNLWWLWIAFTVPLTLGIMLGWWYYRKKEKKIEENARLQEERQAEKSKAGV